MASSLLSLRVAGGVPGRSIDLKPERRPGVPMERLPPHALQGTHWRQPTQQATRVRVTKRMELSKLTPVFGSAQPPAGVSGLIRRLAYRVPEHHPQHWMLLLAADRVDVLGHRFGRFAKWLPLALPAVAVLSFTVAQRRRQRWLRTARFLYRLAA